jgi:hypothetical protein
VCSALFVNFCSLFFRYANILYIFISFILPTEAPHVLVGLYDVAIAKRAIAKGYYCGGDMPRYEILHNTRDMDSNFVAYLLYLSLPFARVHKKEREMSFDP